MYPSTCTRRPRTQDGQLAYKDAVFLSPHKFVGGPGTPGVLAISMQTAVQQRVPRFRGRSTVAFVNSIVSTATWPRSRAPRGGRDAGDHRVDPRRSRLRAQGGGRHRGDPPPRDELRAARARLLERESRASRSSATPRSSGLRSCRSACATRTADCCTRNFVVALLNDLFGIQARSGCFCAGPYIHRLYPIDDGWSSRMDAAGPRRATMGAKLSLVRLSFNYFIERGGLRLRPRSGPLHRGRRMETSPALSLRARERTLETPRRGAGVPSPRGRLVRVGAARGCDPQPHRRPGHIRGSPREGAASRGRSRGVPADGATRRCAVERGVRARAMVSASNRGIARALPTERTPC